MVLCISGYRKFNDYDVFKNAVDTFIKTHGTPDMIIFGECAGADRLALKYVQTPEHNVVDYKVYNANWAIHGLSAGPIRNKQMIDVSSHLLAFLSKDSKGTKNAINYANQRGLIVEIINIP